MTVKLEFEIKLNNGMTHTQRVDTHIDSKELLHTRLIRTTYIEEDV